MCKMIQTGLSDSFSETKHLSIVILQGDEDPLVLLTLSPE